MKEFELYWQLGTSPRLMPLALNEDIVGSAVELFLFHFSLMLDEPLKG
jgi:hypothetical protein